MIKRLLFCVMLATAVWSCKKDKTAVTPPVVEPPVVADKGDTAAFASVTLEASHNIVKFTKDVKCVIAGDSITALIPSMSGDRNVVVTFVPKTAGSVVKVNDTVQKSGVSSRNFDKPVTYTLTTPKGLTKSYKFIVKSYTGLPILYLTTSGPVNSKDVYVTGTLKINANNEFEQEITTIPLQVKGRGNSTWDIHPKKPYRLKFTDKAAMLGLPAAKNWVLLANHSDKTLMRTALAFGLGQQMGADFTFKGRFVELVMNGQYNGEYYLTYQVEVNENRVNIPELKKGDIDADKITGGYLLELDERRDEPARFETSRGRPFTIKSPENYPDAQFNYIKNYVQATEDAIFADNFADPTDGYAKYINVESFINWYLIQELVKNQDAQSFSSIYYYKPRGGKLGMGPLWDFDLAVGNVDYSDARYPTGWWITDGPWFSRLFEDPAFRAKVKARWNQIKGNELQNITPFIDKTATYLNRSQQENFRKWDILGSYVWPNPVITGSYAGEVSQIKQWLTTRIAWLDNEFNKM